MISESLVENLAAAKSGVPNEVWAELSSVVARLPAHPDPVSIERATASIVNRDAAWLLADGFLKNRQTTWAEIAAVMVAVGHYQRDGHDVMEIIWTGPTDDRRPVRRLDQVLYDLVAGAKRRIVLVSFAAHRVHHLCEHLKTAIRRGVALTLILESEDESEGQLTSDAIAAFRGVPASRVRLYYWPLALRQRNLSGRPGKLHAKCAVVDEVAVVGSANLTDDAFNRNMELGVLIRDARTVSMIVGHFQNLMRQDILVPVTRTE